MSKTVSGVSTTYLLDGDDEIAEYSGATVLRHYVTGPVVDDRIAHAEGSTITNPTKTYYHVNHQGSVMAMTDGSGNVTQRIGYDEYGNGSPLTGEQFGYAARRYDPETGLYYYRARYYAPAIGRFLQVDPVGYKDNLNLYTYVGNDPLDKLDPSGQNVAAGVIVVGGVVAIGTAYTLSKSCTPGSACERWASDQLDSLLDKVKGIFSDPEKPADKPEEKPGEEPGNSSKPRELVWDDDGKVHGSLPNADDLPQEDLGTRIGDLERSIRNRQREIDSHPAGNPNGSARERREDRQRKQHEERVRREQNF